MKITEGGNVFKLADGSEATQRINKADVIPTVQWLEQLTGLNLVDNMLGSTGYKETSGDLDLAVDVSKITIKSCCSRCEEHSICINGVEKLFGGGATF